MKNESLKRAWAELGGVLKERGRELVSLWALGFLVLTTYGITRPATDSLFLADYTSDDLPKVWLTVALAALLVTTVYNRLAARVPLVRLFFICMSATGVGLALLLSLYLAGMPGVSFALYVFRDLYIVVLVELFWSFANCVFPERTARLVYGSFLIAGTLGELCGTQIVGAAAGLISTAESLWLVLPILALALYVSWKLRDVASQLTAPLQKSTAPWVEGLRVLRRSRYLILLMLLVVTVQIVVTLVDYEYNGFIRAAFTNTEARTRIIGNVYGSIAVAAVVLQLAAGPILRFLGVRRTLLAIPLLLGASLTGFLLLPSLALMLVTKVASKCFDYSLFRAGKEILYIPLSYAEKTQGKALVDIFTYRVAKGATSLLLLGLTFFGVGRGVSFIAAALIFAWVLLTWLLTREHRRMRLAQGVVLSPTPP